MRAFPIFSLQGRRAWFLAALVGAISAAALPPIFFIPALLIGVPGLLLLIDAAASWRQAAWIGFWFGFGMDLIGLYWVTEAILVEAARFWWLVPLAVPALSAGLALFVAAAAAVARLAPSGWRRAVALAGAWTLADLARQFVGTGFPWNPLGSVWAIPGEAGTIFLQLAAWIGAPGLTFLTVLLATTPAFGRRAMASALGVLMLWAGFGILRLQLAAGTAPGVAVVLAQGNVAEGQKWDRALAIDIFRRYLALTRQGVEEAEAEKGPDGKPPAIVVVWPESASPYLVEADPAARQAIMQAAQPAVAALIGSVRFTSGGFPTGAGDKPRNSLIALGPDGNVTGTYDKWHLVPFGEYQPSWAPLPVQVVPGGGFASGPGPATLHLPGVPAIGPIICYEAIFPAQVVDRADRPAWIVNITNDAWFGNSTGPRQHLAAARMRAVEEGMPLMRAANTGISAGFDAFGRELGRLGIDRTGVLVLTLPGALPGPPFARWGLVIPGLVAVLALGVGLAVRRWRVPAATPSSVANASRFLSDAGNSDGGA